MRNNSRNALLNQLVEAESQIKKDKKYDISSIINVDEILKLTDDNEITNLLIENTTKIINIQIKNNITLGEIFSNVFDSISKQGSKCEGVYEKWLELNGINKRTALRYRKRFELYSEVNSTAKDTVAVLSQFYIEHISLDENKEKYIKLLNDGITVKEVMNIIKSENFIENKTKEKVEIIDYSFKEYKNIFKNIDEKAEKLKEKEKIELKKYLEKINNILNKN